MNNQIKKLSYKIIIYSQKKELLEEYLRQVKTQQKKISYIRLKPKEKKLCLRKGPHGRGYAVFVKPRLKIHKWVILCPTLNIMKKINSSQKIPNVYVQPKLL